MSSHHGILVHVVFSTRSRKPVLQDQWRDELFAYIGGTVKEHKAILLKAGGIEDHIHLLIRFNPRFPIAGTIQMLKANSSRWISENQTPRGRFQWQTGYGAFSVSQSMVDVVKRYITDQRQHHRRRTFQEEYIAFLKKNHIEFDERYVFEQEITG